MDIVTQKAKKVDTFDDQGNKNGYLIELFKDKEKTDVYLTTIVPGGFKGYHLHRVRAARYICLKGKIKVILYIEGKRQEHTLNATEPSRLFIPPNVATGLENVGDEEAWLVNYPDPAYDPNLKDEQVEYTQDELERGIVK